MSSGPFQLTNNPAVCTENLDSDALMMQPADQGIRHNASNPLNWARDRRILSQGAMRSRRVVITRIRFYESAQVLLTQCDDMVNALAPDRPNQRRPVTAAQSKTRRRMPQGDAALMAKEQVPRGSLPMLGPTRLNTVAAQSHHVSH